MKFALARHDMLLRRSIEQHGGYVFKTVGDAFCAAFSHAPDALSAVLDAQRALRAEGWPSEIGAIRIRAILHTGAAEERGGDYFGCRSIGRHACSLRDMVIRPSSHRQLRNW